MKMRIEYAIVFILISVVIIPTANALSPAEESPLYKIRLAQALEDMGVPNHVEASINEWSYGSTETEKLNVKAVNVGGQTDQIQSRDISWPSWLVGTCKGPTCNEPSCEFSCKETCKISTPTCHYEYPDHMECTQVGYTCSGGETCKASCQVSCRSENDCKNTNQPSCKGTCASTCAYTCKPTCRDTCSAKSTCRTTCKPTCGTKSTCKPTCDNMPTCGSNPTCQPTCQHTCSNNQVECCPNNQLSEIRS